MKLYHYTSFEKFVYLILPKMQLKFSPFSGCNDPFEFYKAIKIKLSRSTLFGTMNKLSEEFEKQIKEYCLICFSQEVDKRGIKGWQLPTMWAHYGDNHNGVCLEFDFEPTKLQGYGEHSKIEYVESIPEIAPFDDVPRGNEDEWIESAIPKHIEELKSITFFKKLNDWGVENEYRIISKANKCQNYFLPINEALKVVYLGFRASEGGVKSIKAKILYGLLNELNINLEILDDETLSNTNFYNLKFAVEKNKKIRSIEKK